MMNPTAPAHPLSFEKEEKRQLGVFGRQARPYAPPAANKVHDIGIYVCDACIATDRALPLS